MTKNSIVQIDLGDTPKVFFEKQIDRPHGKWGKPNRSFSGTLLFTSTDDYRVQLTYIEEQQKYIVIVYPKRDADFSSIKEVETTLNDFFCSAIKKFNEEFNANVKISIEEQTDEN